MEALDEINDGHVCSACSYALTGKAAETFDSLEVLESSIPEDTKKALVYISGYVTRKDTNIDDTTFYYFKYGSYTRI